MQPIQTRTDIDQLRKIIERYFKVYDVRWDEEIAAFYCQIFNMDTLGTRFNELRKELKQNGYTPILRHEKGEHTILVMKKPKLVYKSVRVNLIMLFLTIFSTVWAGSIYWASRSDWEMEETIDIFTVVLNPNYALFGALSFALPLMTILGAHELAHYFAAKRHGVDASLPFFLPIPPIIGPFGTFGAFISMREPIPNKKALVDIGAAGPIAGFLVAIPVTILGLILSDLYPVTSPETNENVVYIGVPIIFMGLESIFPIPGGSLMHPTLFAGWVGLFVTGLNLLPCGQLDGGHISRALVGDKSKYLSYATIAAMIGFGLIFPGWIILAFLIMFLGLKHPPPLDDLSSLDTRRKVIGVFSILMLLLCFHPVPLMPAGKLNYDFELSCENTEVNITAEEVATYQIILNNTGDLKDTINVTAMINISESKAMSEYWNITFENNTIKAGEKSKNISIELKEEEFSTFTLLVKPPSNATHLENVSIEIYAVSENDTDENHEIKIHTTIKQDYGICVESKEKEKIVTPGNSTIFNINIKNTGGKNERINLLFDFEEGNTSNWNVSVIFEENITYYDNSTIPIFVDLSNGTSKTALLNVTAKENSTVGEEAKIRVIGDIVGQEKIIGENKIILTVKID